MQSAAHSNAKKLILDALHLDDSLPGPDAVRRMGPDDWECLLEFARMHRLGPMLHHRLASLADIVPETVWDRLKASQRRHAMRNLKIYRELVTVTRILNDAGIASIALKGAYLARFAYPDPGLRAMRDLDLLIRPEQVIEAFEILKANGYQQTCDDGLPEIHFTHREHLSPLASFEGIAIELHHRLIFEAHSVLLSSLHDALWTRSIIREVGGTKIRFLCTEDLLLHLCVHATYRHQFDLGPLALTDIAFLVGTHRIDWQDFLRGLSHGNWQRGALSLLYLAKLHLGAKIPDEVLKTMGENICESLWIEAAEYLLFSDLSDQRLMTENMTNIMYSGSFFGKILLLYSVAFPPRLSIALDYPVCVDSPMAFLYYPRRWYRLIREKLPVLLREFRGGDDELRRLSMYRQILDGWLHDSADQPKNAVSTSQVH